MSFRLFLNDKETTKSNNFNFKERESLVVIDLGQLSQIKSNHSTELGLLKHYGKMILGKEVLDSVINNWALGKLYYLVKGQVLSVKTYKVDEVKTLLATYTSTKNNPVDMYNLIVFTYSLLKTDAKTFTFGMDDASINMLIDFNTRSDSKKFYGAISNDARIKFINYLKLAFYELNIKYVPVVITDGYRDANLQMIRMTVDKDLAYYLKKVPLNGKSWYYINLIKFLYESKMTKEEMTQCIDEKTKGNTVFSDKGKNLMKIHLIPGNFASLQTTLKEMFKPEIVFAPSYHMFGQALDLSDNGNLKETANRVLKVAGQKYDDSDHVHLNLN